VTPVRFVSAIVTEKGVLTPPFAGALRKLFR
jgi:methylthioribose-1-phosphate isomerase